MKSGTVEFKAKSVNCIINEGLDYFQDVNKKCNLTIDLLNTGRVDNATAEKIHKSFNIHVSNHEKSMGYALDLSLALKAVLAETKQALNILGISIERSSVSM